MGINSIIAKKLGEDFSLRENHNILSRGVMAVERIYGEPIARDSELASTLLELRVPLFDPSSREVAYHTINSRYSELRGGEAAKGVNIKSVLKDICKIKEALDSDVSRLDVFLPNVILREGKLVWVDALI